VNDFLKTKTSAYLMPYGKLVFTEMINLQLSFHFGAFDLLKEKSIEEFTNWWVRFIGGDNY